MRRKTVSFLFGLLVLAALAPRTSHAQVIDPLPVGGSKMRQVTPTPSPWSTVLLKPLFLPMLGSLVPTWTLQSSASLELDRRIHRLGTR